MNINKPEVVLHKGVQPLQIVDILRKYKPFTYSVHDGTMIGSHHLYDLDIVVGSDMTLGEFSYEIRHQIQKSLGHHTDKLILPKLDKHSLNVTQLDKTSLSNIRSESGYNVTYKYVMVNKWDRHPDLWNSISNRFSKDSERERILGYINAISFSGICKTLTNSYFPDTNINQIIIRTTDLIIDVGVCINNILPDKSWLINFTYHGVYATFWYITVPSITEPQLQILRGKITALEDLERLMERNECPF